MNDDMSAADRHLSLDAIRGVAVMGILLLNIFNFAMPSAGYTNPLAWGGTRSIDIAAWATGFVLFEGKMRGLFSLLFGAGVALVVDRAREHGKSGANVHFRRLFWLLLFGLAHHLLIWDGDILVQYALVGAAAFAFVACSDTVLRRWAVGLLAASVLVHAAMMGGAYGLKMRADSPTATAADKRAYTETVRAFAKPGSPAITRDLAIYRGDYRSIVSARADKALGSIRNILMFVGLESLGLMVLGMLFLRNGFLTGSWPDGRYRRWAIRGYLIGIPPLIALALWNRATGFDALAVFSTQIAWSEPFRYAVMIAHAAVCMLLIRRYAASPLVARIAAAGRMAFTNYVATSLIMTGIFYGYGLGLYGRVGRAELYLVVLAVCAAMLLWSKPWLDLHRYGPLEWLWRSLSRGETQPMLKV